MGALAGLLLGVGLLLIVQWRWWPEPTTAPRQPTAGPVRRRLDAAGLGDVGAARVVLTCLGAAVAGTVVMVVVSGSLTVGVAFGVLAGWLPLGALGRRAARRRLALVTAWPDAVDDLASAVRAGLSLPDAIGALAERGPEVLRGPFGRFAADHRVTGAFGVCLDRLKADLADPVDPASSRRCDGPRRSAAPKPAGCCARCRPCCARTRAHGEDFLGRPVGGQRRAPRRHRGPPSRCCRCGRARWRRTTRPGSRRAAHRGRASAAAYLLMRHLGRLPVDERVRASARRARGARRRDGRGRRPAPWQPACSRGRTPSIGDRIAPYLEGPSASTVQQDDAGVRLDASTFTRLTAPALRAAATGLPRYGRGTPAGATAGRDPGIVPPRAGDLGRCGPVGGRCRARAARRRGSPGAPGRRARARRHRGGRGGAARRPATERQVVRRRDAVRAGLPSVSDLLALAVASGESPARRSTASRASRTDRSPTSAGACADTAAA
ncbi:MAG: hypothetical protein U0S36_15240 [Candidatus Nanopelagicales bacterium]